MKMPPHIVKTTTALLLMFTVTGQAQDVPDNLKGSGEVVITSGGGSWEDAQKKAFFEPFTRDTGIKVVLVPEDHAKLLASVKLGQPEADVTSVPGGTLAGFVSKGAVEEMDYSFFAPETLSSIPENLKNKNGVGALLYSVAVSYNTTKYPDGGKQPRTGRLLQRHGVSRPAQPAQVREDGGWRPARRRADG